MIKEIYTQLYLHNRMSGINTIVFTHTLGIIRENEDINIQKEIKWQ